MTAKTKKAAAPEAPKPEPVIEQPTPTTDAPAAEQAPEPDVAITQSGAVLPVEVVSVTHLHVAQMTPEIAEGETELPTDHQEGSIVQFKGLTPVTIAQVVDKFLIELEAQLESKKVTVEVDRAGRAWLAERGYDPKMGARPMARIIQENIKRKLAEELLFGRLINGGHVAVTVRDDELQVEIAEEEAVP